MLKAESDKSTATNTIAAAERDGVRSKAAAMQEPERQPSDDMRSGENALSATYSDGDTETAEQIRQRAIRDVVAGLAHNLNNIMAISLGTAEQMIEETPGDHPLHSWARMNMTAAQRAAHMTRRLMMYSGISAVACERVDVDDEIGELLACRGADCPEPIHIRLDCRSAAVDMDRDAFFETIESLLDNSLSAIDGLENGLVEIRSSVEADTETAGRDLAVIEILDNGTGMSADTLRRAREPFFTTRGIGEGIGLGLSFADGFVRSCGGSLEICSRDDGGTCVRLKLPVAPELGEKTD